jgi:hypothetical protein
MAMAMLRHNPACYKTIGIKMSSCQLQQWSRQALQWKIRTGAAIIVFALSR